MTSRLTSTPLPAPAPDRGAPSGLTPESHVLRVPAGELAVAARDAVTIASEADSLVLTAATEIILSVGRSTLTLRADGTILLNGQRMTLTAPAMLDLNPDPAPPADGTRAAVAADGTDEGAARPCGCAGSPRATREQGP